MPARFALDYTFFLNILFVVLAGLLVWLARRHSHGGMDHDMPGDTWIKTVAAVVAAVVTGGGLAAFVLAG